MNQLSTCCLANPTRSYTQLISFDHYHPRLWPNLDAAWLIMQPAANYLDAVRRRTRRLGPTSYRHLLQDSLQKPAASVEIRPSDSTSNLRQVPRMKQSEMKMNVKPSQTPQNLVHRKPREAKRGKTLGLMLGLISIWWKLFPSFT